MGVFKKQKQEKQDNRGQVHSASSPGALQNTPEKSQSIIGKTLFIKGEIFSDEEVMIEGKIEGKLNIKHRVVVGISGLVNADIEAREVVIKGTVNGNVRGSHKVEVVPDGVLNGNIVAQRVVLAEGAVFKGSVDMSLKEEKKQDPTPQDVTRDVSA